MEVEFVSDETSEDENCGLDGNTEGYLKIDGERCGICMDIVFDRGVLDCCQHWFCFTCIDNWATITSLCPLCQNEFQLITCVPVYDTDGCNQTDDESNLSDDDWFIEGKNSTLSFPSYFIDESAVVCLGEDGCKVQRGSVTLGEESDIDTSIACDSCDKWYHAFCVGFDPEGNCDNSWLCPRCTVDKDPQKPDRGSGFWKSSQHGSEFIVSNHVAEASGRVLVSVANDHETTTLSSVIDGHQETQDSHELVLDSIEDWENTWSHSSISNALNSEATKFDGRYCRPNLCHKELENLSVVNSDSVLHRGPLAKLKISADDTVQENLGDPDKNIVGSDLDPHLGLPVDSVEKTIHPDVEIMLTFPEPGFSSKDFLLAQNMAFHEKESLSPESTIFPEKEIVAETTLAERKHLSSRHMDDGEDDILTKKIKVDGDHQPMTPMEPPAVVTMSDDTYSISSRGKFICRREDDTTDIMDIIKGTDDRSLKQLRHKSVPNKNERENASGLRLKKIMRVAGDDKDFSVQELRNKIREAVRNKSSGDIEKNLFDPKLLDAFRAALAGSGTENRKATLYVKGKKSFLQKGKSRESLTKKIYGDGGKRRRDWTRDCEVEFWKHRCMQASRPEKVETLKSVLDLLRDNNSDFTKEIQDTQKDEKRSPLLERLYLADTSIFPRKNDIRPVSSLETVETSEQRDCGSIGKPSTSETMIKCLDKNLSESGTELSSVKVMKSGSYAHQKREPDGSSSHATSSMKKPRNKDKPMNSDVKSDKRKWALEVLARKSATSGDGLEKTEGANAILKGKFSLLAQLPIDMRPVLAPCRHNKISIPVRQAQLHRLAEHFLKRTKLSIICGTAETELAIADAVNVEKQLAEKSNSKLVYLNLCSQELLRKPDDKNPGRAEGSNICSTSKHPSSEETKETDDCSLGVDVDEALIKAGLITDSPPNCPSNHSRTKVAGELDSLEKIDGERDGPDNVLEIISHVEADIYGDFEYTLEEDDFIGASSLTISKQWSEPAKIKVLLSSLKPEKQDLLDHAEALIVESGQDTNGKGGYARSCSVDNDKKQDHDSAHKKEDSNTDLVQSSAIDEVCAELYGADEEPVTEAAPAPCVGEMQKKSGAKHESNKDSSRSSVLKKVEAYIKEHLRPLCKSSVITVEQYRWAVGKTTEKVMKYHSKEKNANFLIREGDKVKKLAGQYVEAATTTQIKTVTS